MPLVLLHRKAGRVNDDMFAKLSAALPEMIANALHVPENPKAHLPAEWVEVRASIGSEFDVNTKDVGIFILANDYPERRENHVYRNNQIIESVRGFMRDYDRNITIYVWSWLGDGSYGEV